MTLRGGTKKKLKKFSADYLWNFGRDEGNKKNEIFIPRIFVN